MVEGDQPDGEDLGDVEVEDQVAGVVGCEGECLSVDCVLAIDGSGGAAYQRC